MRLGVYKRIGNAIRSGGSVAVADHNGTWYVDRQMGDDKRRAV